MDYFQTNEASNYSDAAKKRNRIILIIAAVAIGLVGFYAVGRVHKFTGLCFIQDAPYHTNEMVYQRPDTDKIFDKIDEIIEVVNSKATFIRSLKQLSLWKRIMKISILCQLWLMSSIKAILLMISSRKRWSSLERLPPYFNKTRRNVYFL